MRLLVIFFDSSETLLTSGLSTWWSFAVPCWSRCSFDVAGFLLLPAVCPPRVLASSRYYLLANVLLFAILLCLSPCSQFVILLFLFLCFFVHLAICIVHYFFSAAIGASSHLSGQRR